jgi:hypothetical protein
MSLQLAEQSDKSKKTPSHQGATGTMTQPSMAMSEGMCKGCSKMHKAGEACIKKGADFIASDGKKKSTGVVGVLPKTDDKLGPGMSGPASKEVESPGSGGDVKKAKALGKAAPSPANKQMMHQYGIDASARAAAPAPAPVGAAPQLTHPGDMSRAHSIVGAMGGAFQPKAPVVSGMSLARHGGDKMSIQKAAMPFGNGIKPGSGTPAGMVKAGPPMARPPGGGQPGSTAPAPTAKPVAPKLGGAPSAPVGAGSAPKMGAAPMAPKPPKPFGKSEYELNKNELGDCPICRKSDHSGDCVK